MTLDDLIGNESLRRREFPCVEHGICAHHAGVCPLPRVAIEAIEEYAARAGQLNQENDWSIARVSEARKSAARLIGAKAGEITLMGPTSLGLSLVANGLDWREGDRVIYHADDYPANVYPWLALAERGVEPVGIRPQQPGAITWETIEPHLHDRTRLVSLSTAFFVSGFRIDYAQIGRRLHERGILFCLDAIQTLGAFAMDVEHVDFLSADSHKWMLGPLGAGILYVKSEHHDRLRPTLLGSWNVNSPNFIAQDRIEYYPGGRRYEPGALNYPGLIGMAASIDMLLDFGIEAIAQRLLDVRQDLLEKARGLGYELYLDDEHVPSNHRTSIVSLTHPSRDLQAAFKRLGENKITASLRHDRAGRMALRLSPHFYNTFDEMDRIVALLA